MAFPFMDYYISCALKQQATWHTWKVLEGQSYMLQDIFFHFISFLFIKVGWQLFISFSKKRAKFKISDQPLYMSSKALDYDSWKCCCKSSLYLNVVSLCEQAYCFSPLWSNTCYVLALKQKAYGFSHHGALHILSSESYLTSMESFGRTILHSAG